MDGSTDLRGMEQEAYRAYWSDGIVDIYVGVSMLFMGAMWIWVNDLSGIAGILPAILVAPMLAARRRYVEARLGHVEWRPARRSWERRNQLAMLAVGLGLLLIVFVAYLTLADGAGSPRLAPGILAWILALLGIGLAFLLDARRMLLYAAVLAVGGVVVVLLQAEPGWPMLVAGVIATGVGLHLLRRFSRRYPLVDDR